MDRIIKRVDFPKIMQPQLLKVCAYTRVSSGKDAMLHSLSAQISHYSEMIQSHTGWVYCGVYSDEGISGTNTKRRAGFNEMIEDAMAGKINLIVTKSVSRFARNTVDSLVTIRKLKEKGVQVYFEKKRAFTPSTAKVNCCSPSCRALPRKKAVPFPKMSPGDSGNALQTARSTFHTNSFSVTAKERTVFPKSYRKRRLLSAESTLDSWRG